MKPSKISHVALNEFLNINKKVWLGWCFYCLFVIICLMLISVEGSNAKHGIFDLIAGLGGLFGSTNQLMFIAFGIPFIVIMQIQFMTHNEREFVVIKSGSRFRTWQSLALITVYLSFFLTLFILAVSLLIGGLLEGFQNSWLSNNGTISKILNNKQYFNEVSPHLATYKVILTLFITKFLGFLTIAFLTLFFKQWVRNSAFIIIILIGLAAIDQLGILPFEFFTFAASLNYKDWLNPVLSIYHCFYFFILLLVLYGVTGLLYERKDFLSWEIEQS